MAKKNIVQAANEKALLYDALSEHHKDLARLIQQGLALEYMFKLGLDRCFIVNFDYNLVEEYNTLEEVVELYKRSKGAWGNE